MARPIPVILDTNFFFIPFKFKVDIFSELDRIIESAYEVILLSPVRNELLKLIKTADGINKRHAKAALTLAERCTLKNVSILEGESVDDLIIRMAKKENAIVGTGDKKLRDRLRKEKIQVICLRARKYLSFI
ncbi:MAG: type II toxin-antitoxin system VapC family toxin [Candidatus Helarchaeales archaeon]